MRTTPRVLSVILTLLLISSPSLSTSYDYYSFALEWSGTVCKFHKCDFDRSYAKTFNLHGLWPSRNNGHHPFYCSQTKFDFSSLSNSLRSNLNLYWSGLYSSQQEFLDHEWSKHGTCWNKNYGDLSRVPEGIDSWLTVARSHSNQVPADFLNTAVMLSKKVYNIYDALHKYEIEPSDEKTYAREQISKAFKLAYGVEVQINCLRDESGNSYFSDVLLCLDKNFLPINCKEKGFIVGSACPASQLIYPVKESHLAKGGENMVGNEIIF